MNQNQDQNTLADTGEAGTKGHPSFTSDVSGMGSKRRKFNQIGSILLGVVMTLDLLSAISDGNTSAIVVDTAVILFVVWFYRRNFHKSPQHTDIFSDPPHNSASEAPVQPEAQSDSSTAKTVGGFVLVFIVIVLARALGGAFGDWIRSDSADGSLSSQEFLADYTIKEYVASDFGFRVNFPGFPLRETETVDLEGYSVPMWYYYRELPDGEFYSFFVNDYSGVPIESSMLSLEGALNGAAQNVEGGRLLSAYPSTLGGEQALEGKYLIPLEGSEYDAYARVTVRGMRMYGVMIIRSTYSDFVSFADSFTFTD